MFSSSSLLLTEHTEYLPTRKIMTVLKAEWSVSVLIEDYSERILFYYLGGHLLSSFGWLIKFS